MDNIQTEFVMAQTVARNKKQSDYPFTKNKEYGNFPTTSITTTKFYGRLQVNLR